MHVKGQNSRTCFFCNHSFEFKKNSVVVEWSEIFEELLLQPVRGFELLCPTSNRIIVKRPAETAYAVRDQENFGDFKRI